MTAFHTKLAVREIRLRTGTSPRFERIRIVGGTLPEEVRFEFATKYKTTVVAAANTETEKLMPCGMRYPEPFRARPNFFIPILAVSSYVVPFFMLMFMSQNLHSVPLAFKFIRFLNKHIPQIYIPEGFPYALLILFLLALPMLAGGLLAYALSKNSKLRLKQKILLWFVPVFILVTLEVFSGTIFTNEKPYPARPLNAAPY